MGISNIKNLALKYASNAVFWLTYEVLPWIAKNDKICFEIDHRQISAGNCTKNMPIRVTVTQKRPWREEKVLYLVALMTSKVAIYIRFR